MGLVVEVAGEIKLPVSVQQSIYFLHHYVYNKKGQFFTPTRAEPDGLYYPRNIKKFAAVMKSEGVDIPFKDLRITKQVDVEIKLSDGFKLKKDQQRCTSMLKKLHTKKEYSAVLEAPCGWGKTFQLAYYMWMLQQKTMILVDRTVLVTQMVSEIEANSNIKVNVLSSKNKEVGDINIATLQFLMQNPDVVKKLGKEIGSVVLDECHVAPAAKFCKIIGQFPALYRLGLSATPTRSDGLTRVITDVFTNNRVVGVNDGLSCTIVLLSRHEEFSFSSMNQYKAYLDVFLTQASVSNDVSYLCSSLRDKGRVTLLYATSKDVQAHYKKLLTAAGLRCVVINSHTKKREEIFEKINEDEFDVVIAGTVLNKGVSIKRLDTCINLATLTKEDIEQLVGRLRREYPNKKQPIILDFLFEGALYRKSDVRKLAYYGLVQKYQDKVVRRGNFEELKASLNLRRSN